MLMLCPIYPSSSSLEEKLVYKNPFVDILDNILIHPFENPFAQHQAENQVDLVVYQPRVQPMNQLRMDQPIFEFLITDQNDNNNLKTIPISILPKFYDLINEDLDIFFFEFDILCRSYGYTTDAHRLKLFYATLKESILIWFRS